MKNYIKELTQEYNIPYNEEEFEEYIKKDKEQTQYLLDNFGESSWHINDFANAVRNEEISESFFRKLVRFEMDKCFKRINNVDK
jgi:hypothetical protein